MQSKVLLKRGCTLAQGNYFSEPLTAEAFESMIRSATPAEVPDFFAEPPRPAEGNDSASS
jgi:predicted signal transduction protein with EAL and GGDEF domain